MAVVGLQRRRREEKGGGILGSVLGGIAGLAAAPFTGGASLAAIPAASFAGSKIGGIIGEAISPRKVIEPGGPSPLQSAVAADPEAQFAALRNISAELMSSSELSQPEQQELAGIFNPALEIINERLKIKRRRFDRGGSTVLT